MEIIIYGLEGGWWCDLILSMKGPVPEPGTQALCAPFPGANLAILDTADSQSESHSEAVPKTRVI